MRKEYDFRKAKRGPVVHVPKGKTRITIRPDDDVLEWFFAKSNPRRAAQSGMICRMVMRLHGPLAR